MRRASLVAPEARASTLARIAALALALTLGCKPSPSSSSPSAPPSSIAQAEELRKGGASWTNAEVRAHYVALVATIGPANERWRREGMSAEERARRAFTMRHDARLLTRAMMSSRDEVEALGRRDQEKYGNPDGPTFEQLVEGGKKKGLTGDAVFEGIVES